MATRAAIAAKDRRSREEIAAKDRALKDRHHREEMRIKEKDVNYQGLKNSAGATKDLVSAAGGLGALMNDPEFYKQFGIDKVASLPLWHRIGLPLHSNWLTKPLTGSWSQASHDVLPGLCIIWFIPSLANNSPSNVSATILNQTNPINLSLTRFQAQLLKNNSRVPNNDAADYGLYWYAVDGLLEEMYAIRNALRAYNTYHATNAYLAKLYIIAFGFDYDNFVANAPQYRMLLQKLISMFNTSFVLPSDFNFIKRRLWMHNVVIRDRESPSAQGYIFRSQYSVTLAADENKVSVNRLSGSLWTWDSFSRSIMTKTQNLVNSVGIVEMTANLRAGIPDNKVLQLSEFNYDETLVFDDNVHDLEQVHNIRTLPVFTGDTYSYYNQQFAENTGLTATQIYTDDDGYLYQGGIVAGSQNGMAAYINVYLGENLCSHLMCCSDKDFLDFYGDKMPSQDSVLEATRLRATFFPTMYGLKTTTTFPLKYCGTEIAISMTAVLMSSAYEAQYVHFGTDLICNSNEAINYGVLSNISRFDWHPAIRCHIVTNGAGTSDDPVTSTTYFTLGEFDSVAEIGEDNLKWLHDACALSEFAIPDASYTK